jgi:hypothetical protein
MGKRNTAKLGATVEQSLYGTWKWTCHLCDSYAHVPDDTAEDSGTQATRHNKWAHAAKAYPITVKPY